MQISALVSELDALLDVSAFKDASYNGLQVQGRDEIQHIVTAADASQMNIERAADCGADALIVHHGLFWRGADPRAVGPLGRRIRTALAADLNIIAYHLPLDGHPVWGNNSCLTALFDYKARDFLVPGDKTSLAMIMELKAPVSVQDAAQLLARRLRTKVEVLGVNDPVRGLHRIAVCSGSGSFLVDEGMIAGCDALITGDVHEQTYALAKEQGLTVFAAGHHATEQDGVCVLGETAAAQFGLQHQHLPYEQELSSLWYRN